MASRSGWCIELTRKTMIICFILSFLHERYTHHMLNVKFACVEVICLPFSECNPLYQNHNRGMRYAMRTSKLTLVVNSYLKSFIFMSSLSLDKFLTYSFWWPMYLGFHFLQC